MSRARDPQGAAFKKGGRRGGLGNAEFAPAAEPKLGLPVGFVAI